MPDVVILCGGKGTRAYPDTLEVPKPLLCVDGVPVVEHVMRIYASQGYRRFVLATGYLGSMIAERYAEPPDGWEVVVVDTGQDTETGERVRLAAQHVQGDRFFATYADGLGNVDLHALLRLHVERGALATVTTVPLPSQYGVLESDDTGRIVRFREKPLLGDHWINGGFFVFERSALEHWEGQVLERETLPGLARLGALYAYRHAGFWKSMDTYKDRQELDALARAGSPPWQVAPTVPAAAVAPARAAAVDAGTVAGASRPARSPAGGTLLLVDDEPPGSTGASRAATAVGAPSTRGRRPWGSVTGHSTVPDREVGSRRMVAVTVATAVLDLLALLVAYRFVAFLATHADGPIRARLVGSDRPELLLTAPLWLVAFAAYGLYDRRRLVAASEEARRLFHGVTMGAVVVVLGTFVANNDVGRSFLALLWLTSLVTVGTVRIAVRRAVHRLAARGAIGTRVLIVGTNDEAMSIARRLCRQPWLGYAPVGFVATDGGLFDDDGVPVVGSVEDLRGAVQRVGAGAAVIASTAVRPDRLAELCTTLQALDVDVRISPSIPDVAAARLAVEPLDGMAVLSFRQPQLSRSQKILKRAIDVTASAALLVLAAPLLAAIALLVRLTSRGPAIFRQVRVGEGGRPFVLFKFRTMSTGAEDLVLDLRDRNQADGLLFKLAEDPRVTRLGAWLRRWGLDELPQLWNVLRGEMSLVGPRPPLPEETARYDEWVRGRLKVKPGITGLWQVKGGHLLSFEDYVRYDLFYVENWSLGLDLYALAKTIPALLYRRGLA